jgi:hypothetical protein
MLSPNELLRGFHSSSGSRRTGYLSCSGAHRSSSLRSQVGDRTGCRAARERLAAFPPDCTANDCCLRGILLLCSKQGNPRTYYREVDEHSPCCYFCVWVRREEVLGFPQQMDILGRIGPSKCWSLCTTLTSSLGASQLFLAYRCCWPARISPGFLFVGAYLQTKTTKNC